jgi:hypothetical protein
MRVIFLDIDGVLNCKRTPNPRKFPYIVDQKLLERFRGLVARADAAVVLSSTWRYDPAGLFSAKHWGIPFSDELPLFQPSAAVGLTDRIATGSRLTCRGRRTKHAPHQD